MFARNNFWGKLFFGTALVFCLSALGGGTAQAALYSTYADISNTSTVSAMPTWEILQIYKMPIRGRINSIQIKANGIDGGGTSTLRPGVCRVAENAVKAVCVSSYVWANENPYISRGLKWYNYTFPDTLFDKDAYVKLYFDKGGSRLFWQEYAIKAPSSTYADGVTWIVGSSYTPEQNFDMQVLLDITPCNDAFSGHVFNTSTGEAVAGAGVRMMLSGFSATVESCEAFLSAYASRGDVFCHPDEGAGLRTLTDSVGYFNFLAPEEVGSNFTVQTSAHDFATTTVPYSEIYTNNGACYNPISHDFYLEPVIKRTPIVIVPGILGSYLKNVIGEEVWPNPALMVMDYWDLHLNQLILPSDGIPQESEIMFATDILRSVGSSNYFDDLINEFERGGYVENRDLFVFPYDWRLNLAGSSNLLKTKIDAIKSQTGQEKVDIIAHSMGGLVAKKYIEDYGQNSVDKFIDIATPHLGAPKAVKILMYGDDLNIELFGNKILNSDRIRTISQNMPAIYQLLPSRAFFDSTLSDNGRYIADMDDYDQNGISGNLNFGQSMEFLKNSGRNEYLLTKNDELHNQIDNFNSADYGIKAYNIVGCGQPTIGKIYVLNKEKNGYEYRLKYVSGDGTVPVNSAEDLNNSETLIYTTGAEHSVLPSFTGVKELVAAIAQDKENYFDYADYSNLHQDAGSCALNGYIVSFHSPIELHVYDENNNHIGPNANGDIEMGIAGASYDIIDGNKFAFLPKGHAYRIVGQATDSGTFNARVQDLENGETVKTQYFNNVPLESASTSVQYSLASGAQEVAMDIDEDGDRVFENTITPNAVLDQNESADITKPQTTVTANGTVGQNNWYTSGAQITFDAVDEENGSGILKIEYSMDNGLSWQNYFVPIALNTDGYYNILYKATDRAGNVENTKEIKVNIDKSLPVIDIFAPLNGDDFGRNDALSPVYDVFDSMSGLATDTVKMSLDNLAISATSIGLFDYSLATHTLAIVAQDLAGNMATVTANFTISTDIDGIIADVGVLYSRGWINDKTNKQLLNDLNEIKKQIQLFGQRKVKADERFSEELKKCLVKKKTDWCNKKIIKHGDKFEYVFNKIYQKYLSVRYESILNDINHYLKKTWITDGASIILKEDINYLINILK